MSTIVKHTNSWVITNADSSEVGAPFNAAAAVMDVQFNLTIQNQLGTLWSGKIDSLGGLTGANELLKFGNLVDSFLSQYP